MTGFHESELNFLLQLEVFCGFADIARDIGDPRGSPRQSWDRWGHRRDQQALEGAGAAIRPGAAFLVPTYSIHPHVGRSCSFTLDSHGEACATVEG